MEFLRAWIDLLRAPLALFKGVADVGKFLLPFLLTSLSAVAAYWGTVAWYVVPATALVVFYLSLTAGMAWERAMTPSAKISSLMLDTRGWTGGWGKITGLFYMAIKNGPAPAVITVKIVGIESPGTKSVERSWTGHWRGLSPEFDGSLTPLAVSEYGLIGITNLRSGNPALFIWSSESASTERFPIVSPDLPLERQGVTRIDVVVTCETQDRDGPKIRAQERSFYIAPDPGSAVRYKVSEQKPPVTSPPLWLAVRRAIYGTYLRFATPRPRKPRSRSK
jgi:hypothetical protein